MTQNQTKNNTKPEISLSCYKKQAFEMLTNKWTPAVWGIWIGIYGVLPVVAEIVITALTFKFIGGVVGGNDADQSAAPKLPIDHTDPIEQPSVGKEIAKNVFNIFRAPEAAAATGGVKPSFTPQARTWITVIMFVFSSASYAAQQWFHAECEFEKQSE